MRLMIVDDERAVREGLRETVDWNSAAITEVCTARNAIEALNEMRRNPADLVITDIRMPGMDGLELSGQIKQRWPATRIILLSAYAEFSYARYALTLGVSNYLIKPVDVPQILNAVKELTADYRQQHTNSHVQTVFDEVERWLLGAAPMPDPLRDYHYAYGLILQWRTDNDRNTESHAFCKRLSGVILSTLQMDFVVFPVGESNNGTMLFIIPETQGAFRQKMLDNLNRELDQIIWQMGRETLSISGAISDRFPIAEAKKALSQVQTLILQRFFLGDGMVFTSDTIPKRSQESLPTLKPFLPELQDAVHKRDIEKSLALLHHILSGYRFGSLEDIDQIHDNCHALLRLLMDQFSSPRISRLFFEQNGCLKTRCETLDEWTSYLEMTYSAVLELASHGGKKQNLFLVSELKKFAESNYLDSNLSITMAAEVLQRNPNYLSHLFAQNENCSFSEYVNRLRIECAKSLLQQTLLASYEIAAQSGFTNYRYFSQVFKKMTGLSPLQWRTSAQDDAYSMLSPSEQDRE